EQRLAALAYHHLLVDDPAQRENNLAHIVSVADQWSVATEIGTGTESWLSPASNSRGAVWGDAGGDDLPALLLLGAPPPGALAPDHTLALDL
ncbi:MAG: hypothetical protein ACRD1K_20395, partial [Acidimicrobiales bacterium]